MQAEPNCTQRTVGKPEAFRKESGRAELSLGAYLVGCGCAALRLAVRRLTHQFHRRDAEKRRESADAEERDTKSGEFSSLVIERNITLTNSLF